MNKKLSREYLKNYLVVFFLSIIAAFLAFMMLAFADSLLSEALNKNKYPAKDFLREDYRQIDITPIVQNGGGVQMIDKNYKVFFSQGFNPIGKKELTTAEFTAFLTESSRKGIPYHCDVAYQPKSEYWLVVTFPTTIRLDFAFVYNPKASAEEFRRVLPAAFATLLFYLLLVALFAFVYAKVTSRQVLDPLRKLTAGARLLREGDYTARVDLKLKNEFAELQNTFNDMAERIDKEMTLRRKSDEDRKRMILDLSHDLKNPLAGISGYAEYCLNKPSLSEEERNKCLETILENSRRANKLLGELFLLSKLDSPHFTPALSRTDVCEYLRQVCAALVPQLELSRFHYRFDIPENSIFVRLDEENFARVIQNLANNTLRYNAEGTLITVRLRESENEVTILFEDNGKGIPSELAETVFQPFVRGEASRNSDSGGSGLGLAIAQKIIFTHGGDIKLETSPEKGCRFIITLPKDENNLSLI